MTGARTNLAAATRARLPNRPISRAFGGFDRNAMQFWHELASEMSKDWFLENKQRYEAVWVTPMTTLLHDVARRLAPVYEPLKLGEPKALRIYRDVRFSHDKTPYKTHIAAVLRLAGKPIAQVGNAVLYVHLGLDEEYVGGGCYQFDAARLVKWRKAIVGAPGNTLLPIIARLRQAGYIIGGDDYKRVPKGLPPDHPRAELLKKKGLTCAFPEIPAGLVHEPEWADWLVQHAKAMAPLVVWLHRHVG